MNMSRNGGKITKNSICYVELNTPPNTIVSKDNKPFYSVSIHPYFYENLFFVVIITFQILFKYFSNTFGILYIYKN